MEPFSYRKLLRWSWQVAGGARRLSTINLALSLATLVLGQCTIWLLSRIITALGSVPSGDQRVLRLAAAYAALVLIVLALQHAGRIVSFHADAAMQGALQRRLHDTLLDLPPRFHETHDVSETTMIVMTDAAACQPMLRDFIAFPMTQGIGLVSALIFLTASLNQLNDVSGAMQILLAALLLGIPILVYKLSPQLTVAFDTARSAQADAVGEFANSATAPLEVQLLGAQPQRARAFAARLGALLDARVRAQTRQQIGNSLQASISTLLQAGFLTYAAVVAVLTDSAAAGAILSIYYFVPKVIEPVEQILGFIGNLDLIWVQVARVGAVLDAAPQPAAPAAAWTGDVPDVTFDRVTFSYPSAAAPMLSALSYRFEPGRVTAVVGETGTGKSSLLALVNGLREPDSGSVSIGARRVTELLPAELRAVVGVVSQFPLFIAGSVRENFLLGRADATDAEIEAVARDVGLWPALERLGGHRPLDALVPRVIGHGLSGGERRRLAVARCLLRRPQILLLDEPTTGVDARAVGQLLTALQTACKGRTVVVVEHDLDFVRAFADQVCCLAGGRFVDVGTPAELSSRPSIFRDLDLARKQLTSIDNLDVSSVPMPSLMAAPHDDPWAPRKE